MSFDPEIISMSLTFVDQDWDLTSFFLLSSKLHSIRKLKNKLEGENNSCVLLLSVLL